MATWEEVWAGMTPEQQAAYTSGAAGAGAAAATTSAGIASAQETQRQADEGAGRAAATATQAAGEASEQQRARDSYLLSILRASQSGTDIASTPGMLVDGQYRTNSPATAYALQAAGPTSPFSGGKLDWERVMELMTPKGPSTLPSGALEVPAENLAVVQQAFRDYYGAKEGDREFALQFGANPHADQNADPYALPAGTTAGSIDAGDLAAFFGLPPGSAEAGRVLSGDANVGDYIDLIAGGALGGPVGDWQRIAGGDTSAGTILGATMPGTPTGSIANVVGGVVEKTQDEKSLEDQLTGKGDPYIKEDPRSPDYKGDGGDGTGTSSSAMSVTPVSPLARSDFEVQGITEPWLLPGVNETAAQLYQEGLDFAPRDVPQISGGSPEDIALYEKAIKTQRNLAGNVGANANVQAQNLKDIMAGRGLYEAAARGEAPSAAEIQMQMGLTQAQKQALSMAATSRDPGGWYRAQRSMGNLQNNAIAETAKLRAEEMAQARTALGQYYGTLGQAGYYTTAGMAQAAGAASDVTMRELENLSQERNISIQQAAAILSSRATDDTARTNIINSATNLINARTGALQGQSAENQAIAAARQAYANAQSNQQVTMRGQDTSAQSAANVARISTGSAEKIAANQAAATERAAIYGGLATVGAAGVNYLAKDSGESETSTPATPATTPATPSGDTSSQASYIRAVGDAQRQWLSEHPKQTETDSEPSFEEDYPEYEE